MPRPLKQLNPYDSWAVLFGATLRKLRLENGHGRALTQEELGKRIAYSGAAVSAVELGTLRPDAKFVEACERELDGAAILGNLHPFVAAEWDRGQPQGGTQSPIPSPAELASSPAQLRDPGFLTALIKTLPESVQEAKALALKAALSDIGGSPVEAIQLQVDRLCRDYPSVSPLILEPRVNQRLRELHALLDAHLTLTQRRDLIVAAGFLTALLACLEYDMGHRDAAQESRDLALQLGKAAEHQEIAAWAYELSAWFDLVEDRYDEVVSDARAGLLVAPNTSAGVQLAVQEAKAWSRMGNAEEAERALNDGAAILAALPTPTNPEHHFVFDASKLSFYAATCWAWLGKPERAREHAEVVIEQCLAVPGRERWPVRLAETRVDLALIAILEDDLDQACALGDLALDSHRKAGSTLSRVHDLDGALIRSFPRTHQASAFHERFETVRRALERGDPA
ncbi:MAG: helix-turn-helix domain-containing protein [Actinomycetota bacterium]